MISELYTSNIPWRKRAGGAFVHTGNKKYEKLKEENKQTNTNNGTISTAKTDGYNIMSKDSESGERTNYLNLTCTLCTQRKGMHKGNCGSVKGSCKTLFKNLLISTLILWHFEVAISIFFFLLKT